MTDAEIGDLLRHAYAEREEDDKEVSKAQVRGGSGAHHRCDHVIRVFFSILSTTS